MMADIMYADNHVIQERLNVLKKKAAKSSIPIENEIRVVRLDEPEDSNCNATSKYHVSLSSMIFMLRMIMFFLLHCLYLKDIRAV